ncbi:MAG: hypothetical protein WCF12_01785 [Propionicimonas sp.]
MAVAAMALLLGGVAAITMATLSSQLQQASAHAYQYVRAGDIQRQLLGAHAASARAFLARSDADAKGINQEAAQARETAATRIVEMAAQRTDLDGSLESLTHDVLRYAGLVDAAQQHRGEDIGRASLSAANQVLESSLLPTTDALQSAHLAAAQPAGGWVWVLPVLAWLTVIGLAWISVLVARASHRVFNTGLVLAGVFAVLIAFGSVSMANGQASPNATTDGLARVSALATAQRSGAQAYALAANSAATRIWTGDPAVAFHELISQGTQALDPSLDKTLIDRLKELATAGTPAITHAKAHAWAEAEAAILSVQPDAVGPASARVQTQAVADLTTALESLRTAVSGQASATVVLGALSVIGTLGIAVAGIRGLNQRLKEYR